MSDSVSSRVGRSLFGDNLWFGHRISALAGHSTYWSMVSLALGDGPRTSEEAALLDDLSVCGTAADPRVWPLKISRIVASWGAPMAGVAAGALHGGDSFIGPDSAQDAAYWLVDVQRMLGRAPETSRVSVLDREVERAGRVPGFGIPMRDLDERVAAIRNCVERSHKALIGDHWRLVHDVEARLLARASRGLNLSGILAALALDLGFRPRSVGPLVTVMVLGSYIAHAVEGAEQHSSTLHRLPAETVVYVGPALRTSARGTTNA